MNYVCSKCWSISHETFKRYTRQETRTGVRCCNCGHEVSEKVNSEPRVTHIKAITF